MDGLGFMCVFGACFMCVFGACFMCKVPFHFDADRVTSVPIDPVTGLPPDLGGDPERARREPICLPAGERRAEDTRS